MPILSQRPDSEKPKAIGYIRVSTPGQANNGVSLEGQRERITAWCEMYGYTLDAVHVDAGISGKRADNRDGLQKALKAVCKRRGQAIVVYSLSRLARSTQDCLAIAEKLRKAGADLVSLSEKIDTTTAAGKMVFRMLSVLAEFESDLVSERTRAAIDVKRANGERISRHLPYGYDLNGDGKTLVPNKAEQRVITRMRRMRANGKTLNAIADTLNRRHVPTKTDQSQRWSHQVVGKILGRQVGTS